MTHDEVFKLKEEGCLFSYVGSRGDNVIKTTILKSLLEYRCLWERKRTDEQWGLSPSHIQELITKEQLKIDTAFQYLSDMELKKLSLREEFELEVRERNVTDVEFMFLTSNVEYIKWLEAR